MTDSACNCNSLGLLQMRWVAKAALCWTAGRVMYNPDQFLQRWTIFSSKNFGSTDRKFPWQDSCSYVRKILHPLNPPLRRHNAHLQSPAPRKVRKAAAITLFDHLLLDHHLLVWVLQNTLPGVHHQFFTVLLGAPAYRHCSPSIRSMLPSVSYMVFIPALTQP